MTPSDLLAFERRHPGHPPGKEARIMRELDIAPARYYQLLIRASRSLEGISADPITARRIRTMPTRRVTA